MVAGEAEIEPQVRWLSDDEQALWRRLLSVEYRLRERLDHELHTVHGLSNGEYGVLVHLSETPEQALRMADLAERVLLSRSGLTRRLDRLVRHGLVERRVCPSDGRGSMAVLTAKGMAALEAAAPTHVEGVRRYLLEPLTDNGGDLEGLAEGLAKIERALDGA